MTLNNLKYALYVNNQYLLKKIHELKKQFGNIITVSKKEGNIIQELDDGLYVIADKGESYTDDEITTIINEINGG